GDDDRVRQAVRAGVLIRQLVGLLAAGQLLGDLGELGLELLVGELAALEAPAGPDDLLDVQLEDVAALALGVRALAALDEHAQAAAGLAQRERDLLADLVV